MKKILNSLNQLAAEAHKAGHVSLAKQISAILKTAAESHEDMYKRYIPLDAEQKIIFQRANPAFATKLLDKDWVDGQILAQSGDTLRAMNKKEEVARGHEKARVMLQAIADLYKGTGKYPPFVVPAAPISGEAILAILRLANMGSKLTGWADLYKRLADLKDKTRDYLIDLEPNPFSREGVMPGSAGLVPMKDVVPPPTGETLPAGPGKGPPVAPKAKV